MVEEKMLDSAVEIAKEEITDPDNILVEDLEAFQKRLNGLINTLKEECDTSPEGDG